MMRYVESSMGFRNHVYSDTCWCQPYLAVCTCGDDHGQVWVHRDVRTGREDSMPRMAMYSG